MGFFDKLLGRKVKAEQVSPPDEARDRFAAGGEIGGERKFDPGAQMTESAQAEVRAEGVKKLERLRDAAAKMADNAKSEMEVAESMDLEGQAAIADAKYGTAARIQGIFNRIASEKNPISAIAELSNELGAIEAATSDVEDGPAKTAAMQVLRDFRNILLQEYRS